jgi:hypothetical protein
MIFHLYPPDDGDAMHAGLNQILSRLQLSLTPLAFQASCVQPGISSSSYPHKAMRSFGSSPLAIAQDRTSL